MIERLKKVVVWSTAVLMTLPLYLLTNIQTANAATMYQEEFFRGQPNTKYTEASSVDWNDDPIIGQARYTNTPGQNVAWTIKAQQSGIFSVYAKWVARETATDRAIYEIEDSAGQIYSILINQRTDSEGGVVSGTEGIDSGYRLLAQNMQFVGNEEMTFRMRSMLIDDAHILSAARIKIVKESDVSGIPPTAPAIIAPTDYSKDDSVRFTWNPAVDPDSTPVYELEIDGNVVRREISTTSINISGLSDGPHSWRVRAFDGTAYSNWSPMTSPQSFIKDTSAPVFTDTEFRYSSTDITNDGAVPVDINVSAQEVAGRYVIPMNGQFQRFYFNYLGGNLSESLAEENNAIYLRNLTSAQTENLKSYFTSGIFIPGSILSNYYLAVVDGSQPIAYLKVGGQLRLIDGYYYHITQGGENALTIYGDFPVGIYNFNGTIQDMAGNEGTVNFKIEYTRDGYELPAPTSLVADMGEDQAFLSWSEVEGAVSYNLYFKKSSDSSYGGPINVTTTSYTLTGLAAGTSYDFMVSAVSSLDVVGHSAVIAASTEPAATLSEETNVIKQTPNKPKAKSSYQTHGLITPVEAAPQGESDQMTIEKPGNGSTTQSSSDSNVEDEKESINWTPWLILFMLILLAGAASGAYFYWFGDESSKSDAIAIAKKDASTKTNETALIKPTASSKSKVTKQSTEKPPTKRW